MFGPGTPDAKCLGLEGNNNNMHDEKVRVSRKIPQVRGQIGHKSKLEGAQRMQNAPEYVRWYVVNGFADPCTNKRMISV